MPCPSCPAVLSHPQLWGRLQKREVKECRRQRNEVTGPRPQELKGSKPAFEPVCPQTRMQGSHPRTPESSAPSPLVLTTSQLRRPSP